MIYLFRRKKEGDEEDVFEKGKISEKARNQKDEEIEKDSSETSQEEQVGSITI